MPQVAAVEVGPQGVEEDHLGVGRLPQQEIRRTLLARGAQEQVDVGDARLVQVAADGVLVDLVGIDAPLDRCSGDLRRRVGQLGAAPVVDAELQGERGVVLGHLLGVLQLGDDALPQPPGPPGPAHAHAHGVQLVAPPPDHLAVEAHEEADLVRGALPVLGGEGVGGEVLDPQLQRALDHVEQRALTRFVALGAGQSPLLGPAAVAVHDDGDVPGHELLGELGRPGPAGVRIGPTVSPGGGAGRRLRRERFEQAQERSTRRRDRIPFSRCHCR